MTQLDEQGHLCGMMKIEDENHKFLDSCTRYFLLDLQAGILKFYIDHPKSLPKTSSTCKEIELNMISKVSDARKSRPKAGFCFCITHAGDQIYVQASSEQEMNTWIEELNEACRITVPQTKSPTLAPPNSRVEVAGGVVNIVHESANSGEESMEHNMPALSMPSYKSGYAVKQGALRKNWKRRYFVLDTNGLSYFRHDQDKEPIKTIPLSDIKEAKLVKGLHHPHREHLFEVVTSERIFNIQCDTPAESETWISEINKFARRTVASNDYGPVKVLPPLPAHVLPQEEVKPSKTVWNTMTLPVEKRTKTNIRGSKKSWQLW